MVGLVDSHNKNDTRAKLVDKVFLDGKNITQDCFCADDEMGQVSCYKKNNEGHCYLEKENDLLKTRTVATEILHGEVVIVLEK